MVETTPNETEHRSLVVVGFLVCEERKGRHDSSFDPATRGRPGPSARSHDVAHKMKSPSQSHPDGVVALHCFFFVDTSSVHKKFPLFSTHPRRLVCELVFLSFLDYIDSSFFSLRSQSTRGNTNEQCHGMRIGLHHPLRSFVFVCPARRLVGW